MRDDAEHVLADYIVCRCLPRNDERQEYVLQGRISFILRGDTAPDYLIPALVSLVSAVVAPFITEAIKRRLKPEETRERISALLVRTEYANDLVVYRNAIDNIDETLDPRITAHKSLLAILSDKDKAAAYFAGVLVEASSRTRWGRSRYLEKIYRQYLMTHDDPFTRSLRSRWWRR